MMQIRKIFHPTDFTQASESAFFHALKLALTVEGALSILHVDPPNTQKSWSQFPKVRSTLSKWGLLEPNAEKEDLAKLKLYVRKSIARDQDPKKAMINYLEKHHADLMVVATHKRQGLSKWLQPSLSKALAQETGKMTLFLPETARGFVGKEDGCFRMRHILIPVDHSPTPDAAFLAAQMLQNLMGDKFPKISLLHVSDGDKPFPSLNHHPNEWKKELTSKTRSICEHIIEEAHYQDTDCIVMTTAGRNGLFDIFMGSTTEQVIQEAPCPVLAVNANTTEQCLLQKGSTSRVCPEPL